MTPADEAALREIVERRWRTKAMDPDILRDIDDLREAHALGRASGWQAGAEAQREADYDTAYRSSAGAHTLSAIRCAPLVTDDQRASVSGGEKK